MNIDQSLSERITDSRRLIAFRNRLIHKYSSVSNDIPKLLADVREIISDTP